LQKVNIVMPSSSQVLGPLVPSRTGLSSRSWLTISLLAGLIVILPITGLMLEAVKGSSGLWAHLLSTVLPVAMVDTVVLLAGVGIITGAIGTMAAWLVTAYDFPGRRLLEWTLLLPLAVPTYIIAYTYLDILHPIGSVQGAIRWTLGYETPRQFRLPDIRSMTGCILLLGFVLYPYVYIPTRAMFLTQSGNLIDAARTLGVPRRAVFWRVALPLARPAVAIGVALAMMETLNDVGAAEFLGVRTLTVSIYTTWITRTDLPGASQIALALLLIVVALVAMERFARRKQSYATDARRARGLVPQKVGLIKGILLFLAGAMPVLIGFAAPAIYLVVEAWKRYQFAGLSSRVVSEAVSTVTIATLATVVTVGFGLAVAYSNRIRSGRLSAALLRISTIGYAAPGTVVAIGVLIMLAGLDRFIDRTALDWFVDRPTVHGIRCRADIRVDDTVPGDFSGWCRGWSCSCSIVARSCLAHAWPINLGHISSRPPAAIENSHFRCGASGLCRLREGATGNIASAAPQCRDIRHASLWRSSAWHL
jgi:iron(III) transport system permease protein